MSQATPAFADQEGFGFSVVTVATIVVAVAVGTVVRRIGWR